MRSALVWSFWRALAIAEALPSPRPNRLVAEPPPRLLVAPLSRRSDRRAIVAGPPPAVRVFPKDKEILLKKSRQAFLSGREYPWPRWPILRAGSFRFCLLP